MSRAEAQDDADVQAEVQKEDEEEEVYRLVTSIRSY